MVTHFRVGLRYNDPNVFQLLGGTEAMIKVRSPLLREVIDQATQKGERKGKREATEGALLIVLVARFGAEAEAMQTELKSIRDDRLKNLLVLAGTCPDLDSFRAQLPRRSPKRRT